MERIPGEINFGWADPKINELLKNNTSSGRTYTLHYNQNEEFFLKLEEPFRVPRFPFHHSIDKSRPTEAYRESLFALMERVIPLCGTAFEGLTYLFDPAEIFRPFFFQLYKVKEQQFLYLMRLDLQYRPNEASILERGDNDLSHSYETRNLFLECDLIPLSGFITENGKITGCRIEKNVSDTWIGESGRGYVIQGIWIDNDLTKFFSRLLLPDNKRSYPYYPFTCKHRAVCHTVLNLSSRQRRNHLQIIYRAKPFIEKNIDIIQETLRQKDFSLKLPEFIRLKQQVSPYWNKVWEPLIVKPYLNKSDMKEFLVEFNQDTVD